MRGELNGWDSSWSKDLLNGKGERKVVPPGVTRVVFGLHNLCFFLLPFQSSSNINGLKYL